MMPCSDFFEKKKEKVFKHRDTCLARGDRELELHTYVQFLTHAPAQFAPNQAIWFYKTFNATHIFDPFAGWGDRCIAAMAAGVSYTGCDTNKNLKAPFRNMINFFKPQSRALYGNLQFTFKSVSARKVDIDSIPFDFVFSSPPFWDEKEKAVEIYNDQSISEKEKFMDEVLAPLIKKCRKRAPVCLYMNEYMAQYLAKKKIKNVDHYGFSRYANKTIQTYNFYVY